MIKSSLMFRMFVLPTTTFVLAAAYPSLSRDPSVSFNSTDTARVVEATLATTAPLPSLLLKLLPCLTRCRNSLGITSSDRWTEKEFFSLRPNPSLRFRPDSQSFILSANSWPLIHSHKKQSSSICKKIIGTSIFCVSHTGQILTCNICPHVDCSFLLTKHYPKPSGNAKTKSIPIITFSILFNKVI